ncbi:transporter, partial [Bacteroides ovatus]
MVFSFPSLSVFSAKDNKNQQIAFYSFSLSNYWNIFTNYRNVNVSLKPLSLSFEEIKEMMCMKRMVFSFSFLLFVSGINAQITLEECQRKTQENYPLVHQYG